MKSSLLPKAGIGILAYPLLASAQQFDMRTYPFYVFDLSNACFEMLNTTVPECSSLLMATLPSPDEGFNTLDEEHLDHICVPTCRDALVNFRTKAEAACNTTKDAVAFKYNNIIFPPTYQVDLLLLSYDVYCYKDRDTGKFCDLELTKWRRRRDTDFPMECEDCSLGRWRKQLEAPIRYNDEDASLFSKSTSDCGATGYEYTKPTAQYATTLTMGMETSLRSLITPAPTSEQ